MLLTELRPELESEWADTKDIFEVKSMSTYKARWRCPEGHEYSAVVNDRVRYGTGCQECKKIPYTAPELLKYWSDSKSVSQFNPNSSYVADWTCDQGHTFRSSIRAFNKSRSCSACSRIPLVLPADIAGEWIDETPPQNYSKGSDYKALWKCSSGHIYRAGIRSRVVKGVGCQRCKHIPFAKPELVSYWNDPRPIEQFKPGSNLIADWKCPEGHGWRQKIKDFVKRPDCGVCRGRRVVSGLNDAASVLPEDHSLPQDIVSKLSTTSVGSAQKVVISCTKHGDYTTEVRFLLKGAGCPRCAVRRSQGEIEVANFIEQGARSSLFDELIKEWNDTRNVSTVTSGSQYKAQWKCSDGHEWSATVNNRTKGRGCPYCSGRLPVSGKNDLATTNPSLAKQLVDKDLGTKLTDHSNRKVLWMCDKRHQWEATVSNRSKGKGCPYCSGRNPIVGKNDLTILAPHLAEKLNDRSLASTLSPGSTQKVEWKCDSGHIWIAPVYSINAGNGCPKCAKRGVSRAEKDITDIVSQKHKVISSDRSVISPQELDIYIPDRKIAIEYNGLYWHTEEKVGKNYHLDKYQKCRSAGVQLIQIWEDDWTHRRPVVERMLDAKINGRKTIGARKTVLKDIDFKTASALLNYWHIQGAARGTAYIGLYTDTLVAVGVFKTTKGVTYLERYASSIGVQGGLNKMIRYLCPAELVTFADLTVSHGDLYSSWNLDGYLKPDYKYVYKGQRIHKFNFRLKRFREDPELFFEPGLSERQLAELNNIPRIYDAGKARFTYN